MKAKVWDVFKKLNIEYEEVNHSAIFKEKDEANKKVDFKGAMVCKNLLVKPEKSEERYLLCLPLPKRADLKKIQEEIGCRRLSFVKEEELPVLLGVKSGSASVLNIIEKPNTNVKFFLDKEIKQFEKVAFHPNDNTASVLFSPKKLDRILSHFHAQYEWIDM